MKKKIDLNALSIADLQALAKDVEKAIEKKTIENLKAARVAAESAAKKYGLSLADVLGTDKPAKAAGKKLPPKYRHPENPEITWSGKGRQPGWYREAIEAGKTAGELEI